MGERNRRRYQSNQGIESKPRKKYSSEEDAALGQEQIPDNAYFYHQQQ